MITKDEMVRAIQSLPDDATVRNAIERLECIELIEPRIAEADAGNVITQDEVKREMTSLGTGNSGGRR